MDKSGGNQLGVGFPFPDQVEDRFYGNDIGEEIFHPHPNPFPSRERGR